MKETKQGLASAEARAAMHELMGAFESFKAANDERLEAIERKAGDGLLEEKVARIDQAVGAAQDRLERLSAEARRPVVGEIAPSRTPSTTVWSPFPASGGGSGEFKSYLRNGSTAGLIEVKAGLSTGVNSGGYVVPEQVERLIERRLMAASPMREIATVRTVAGGVFKKPVSTVGVESGWVAETAARPETDPATLQLLEFPSADLYASPAATQTLLDDAMVDLDEWLAAEVEDAFAAQETDAFVRGDGTNKPMGFLAYPVEADAAADWGDIGYVASGASGAFEATDPVDRLIDLIYAPQSQYRANARFVMNRRTAGIIRKFKDADGNYVWSPATQPGATSSLLGYPVTEIEQMPDVSADSLSIAFGDFRRGYTVVDRIGTRILRDPYTNKPFVGFYVTKRVGGFLADSTSIKLFKFAAA